MCLACMEYLKGNLTDSEFRHNLREYKAGEHSQEALEKAEISAKELREIQQKNAK